MGQYVVAIFRKLYCTIATTWFPHYTQFLLEHNSRKNRPYWANPKCFAFKLQIVQL